MLCWFLDVKSILKMIPTSYVVVRQLMDDKVQEALGHATETGVINLQDLKKIFDQITGATSLVERVDKDLNAFPPDRRSSFLRGGIAYKIKPDGTIDFQDAIY